MVSCQDACRGARPHWRSRGSTAGPSGAAVLLLLWATGDLRDLGSVGPDTDEPLARDWQGEEVPDPRLHPRLAPLSVARSRPAGVEGPRVRAGRHPMGWRPALPGETLDLEGSPATGGRVQGADLRTKRRQPHRGLLDPVPLRGGGLRPRLRLASLRDVVPREHESRTGRGIERVRAWAMPDCLGSLCHEERTARQRIVSASS